MECELVRVVETLRFLREGGKEGIILTIKCFERIEITKEFYDSLMEIGDWFDAVTDDGSHVLLNYISADDYRENLKEMEEEGIEVSFSYDVLKKIEEWQKRDIDYVVIMGSEEK